MPFLRASRVKLVWGLELALGLELYACAVLALHARGLRATPLLASPGLVIPALVIPPVFYVLVGLVSVRPLSPWRLLAAVGAMCGVHAVLVMATGALFVIPDLVDYGAAVAFALWGSPAVTMLQLTAAPLVLARLRPLLVAPRSASRPGPRVVSTRRPSEAPGGGPTSTTPRAPAAAPGPSPVQSEKAAAAGAAPVAPVASRSPAVTPPPAAGTPNEPAVVSAPVAPAIREPIVTPALDPSVRVSAVISPDATPFGNGGSARAAVGWAAPISPADSMVRVSFSRIADQLPVEMFVRGRKGLNDTSRPGVSLLVPMSLLLPHLAEGVAPVKWNVVADQFPRDELKLTHEEIESRLPDGSLLLPLDEIEPQIPAELLALSAPSVDVRPHLASAEITADEIEATETDAPPVESLDADEAEAESPEAEEEAEVHLVEVDAPETEVPEAEVQALAVQALAAPVFEGPRLSTVAREEPALTAAPELEESERPIGEAAGPSRTVETRPFAAEAEVQALTVQALAAPVFEAPRLSTVAREEPALTEAPEPEESERPIGEAAGHRRTVETRRIAALLAPLMNGLEIGERIGSGTPLVTLVAPTLSEDAVVATAIRVAPLLTDGRLSGPVSQATLTAPEATIVLTPIASPEGGALLVAAVASRASLAWLERLARSAGGEVRGAAPDGVRTSAEPRQAGELRATVVPPAVREVAGSLTAFGRVTPTVLHDTVGVSRVCLFLPGSIDAQALAQVARDLYGALEGAEVGPVASVILRLEEHSFVMRAVAVSSGPTTILVAGGPLARPGLARIELDRAAARLATLGRA